MENIVQGMFGLDPNQVQQQRMMQAQQQAASMAKMNPFERANYGIASGAGQLVQAGAGMMGLQDPAMAAAQKGQQVMQGADTSTPEGLRELAARFNSAGRYQQAFMAAKAANDMETSVSENELRRAQAQKALQPEGKDSPWAKIDPKDYTSASLKVYAKTKDPTDLVSIKTGGAKGEMPPNNLLQKDQRWIQKDGEWVAEIIPGSRSFVAQKDKYAGDKNVVEVLENSYKNTKEKIDFILKPEHKSEFNNLFGGYNAKITQYASGKTADIKQKLDTLKAEMKASGLQIMRSGGGIGQITVAEWAIMEKMIDSLDPTMSEENARKVIEEIGIKMEAISKQGRSKFESEWGGSQFQEWGGSKYSSNKPPLSSFNK